ncbi:MAG: hypothetical protein J2P22_06225 [Nocardioides sp.]|nr:hypothetical protein [Nocardioides sp.]
MTTTDDELLRSVADLYTAYDPAPPDLADGVLARIAVEGLEIEYELLTLVERVDVNAGIRGADTATTGTVALEFAGTAYRVLVRISAAEGGGRRIDGWVLPTVPMRVFLGPAGEDVTAHTPLTAYSDLDGRFEFSAPMTGEVRLWLLPLAAAEGTGESPQSPFVTPPFRV